MQRSANLEAVQHLTTGLALLALLPETPARAQQELDLQMALGPALMAINGYAAPEVKQTYARARELCRQLGDTPQLFPTLWGLWRFYYSRGALPMARELAEQLYQLAQRAAVPTHLLEAHEALGTTLFYLGEYAAARTHLERGLALTDPAAQRALTLRYGEVPGVRCLGFAAHTLWCLGYPAQADALLHLMMAEAYRLRGELLQRQAIPDVAQAEACFQQALAIARRQQAKSWELRAAMSLCRLWRQQGKRDEARQLLAPVYGWFTEGFDTADLQEAKALLTELASGG